MLNILSLDAIYIALIFLIPGYLISSVRAQFVPEIKASGHGYLARLLTLSCINFAISGWAIYLAFARDVDPSTRLAIYGAVLVVSPVALGILSGFGTQRDWIRRLYIILGVSPTHTIPTSWDYQFYKMPESWILVTLKDGTEFAGFWGSKSFASSEPGERDLLIEQVYEIPEEGEWKPTNKKVLIAASEISTIEIYS